MKIFNRAVKFGGETKKINSVTVRVLSYDENGDVLVCTGTTVPTADSVGFAKGCLFIKTNAADGTKGLYENAGLKTASDFNVIGDIASAEIAADAITTAKILDANVTANKIASDAVTTAKILDLNVTTGKLAADAVTNAKLADDAVSLEQLDAGIEPAWVVKFFVLGSTVTTTTLTGLLVGDIVISFIVDGTATVATVAAPDTLPADPADTTYLLVLRAAS